jgi:hypothetical protein
MPFKYGAGCAVWLDNVDESQFFNEAALDIGIDTAETTTFQPGVTPAWKAYIEGLAVAKVTVKGFYDQVNDATMAGDIENGGSYLTNGPSGLSPGDFARLVRVHDTDITESSPVGGAVLLAVAYQGDGVVGFGSSLHGMTADTGTVTGATKDDLAATSTGWMAHLHVSAVTGAPTSYTVKLQDSADGTTWADVAGGAFASVTAPLGGSQRLVSAVGATLRRYVRYVATAVGGTAPTITFGLAYARNR